MRILILFPREKENLSKNYSYNFSLGLSLISATLKTNNYDVDVINLNHCDGKTEDVILKALNNKKYDYACTGHLGIGYLAIKTIFESVRKHPSKPKLILGGIIVTSATKVIMKTLKPDFGVIGEGEETILELFKLLKEGKNPNGIHGIAYIDIQGELITNPARKEIKNLDALPFPDFDGFGFKEYLDNKSLEDNSATIACDYPRTYPIHASRGCPYHCSFCYHYESKYRTRSVKSVIDELRINVPKYGINMISLYDDLFTVTRKRALEFCNEIKVLRQELDVDLKWMCQMSVKTVDEEIFDALKNSGCYGVSYGFESYSQKILKSMGKPIKPEQIDYAYKLTRKFGLVVVANFIFGDIEETVETARETLNYWKTNCPEVSLAFIQLYPGSAMYNYWLTHGKIQDEIKFLEGLSQGKLTTMNTTKNMSDDQFKNLQKEVYSLQLNYRNWSIAKKVIESSKMIYTIIAECPVCNKVGSYKNIQLKNKYKLKVYRYCRNCGARFTILSRTLRMGVSLYVIMTKVFNKIGIFR